MAFCKKTAPSPDGGCADFIRSPIFIANLKSCIFQKSIFGNSNVLMKNVITSKIRPLCGAYVTRTATTNRTFTMLISPKTEPDTQTKSTVEQTYDHFLKTKTMNQSTILPLLRQT